MIGISINGQQLVLFPDTSVDIEFSTAAIDQEIADDHSLPFSVPKAGNEELLGFATEFGVHRRQVVFQGAMLWYDGVPRRPGVVYIEHVEDDSVDLSFTVEGFVSLTRGKRLPELFLPPPIETGGVKDHAKAVNLQAYPAATHCFPMYHAPGFYGSKNPAWNPSAAQWEYMHLYAANEKVTHWYGQYVRLPLGWISLQNGNAGIEPNDAHPLWWKRTAYAIVNHWDWDDGEFLVNTTDVALYTLSPVFYLKHILQECFATLGLTVTGTWFEDARYDSLILFNQHPLDAVSRSKYFRASQVGSITWTTENIATRRLPAQDETNHPNTDPDGLWNNDEMVFYPGEAGMWTFRCWVPPVIPAGNYLTVHLYRWWPGMGWILFDLRTYTQANVASGWDGLTSFDIDVEPGQTAAGYYYSAGYGPQQSITIEGAWVDGWKHSVVLNNVPSDTIVPNEHVPDMELGDLLLDLKTAFGIKVIPDMARGTVSLSYASADLTERLPVDLTPQLRSPVSIQVSDRKPGLHWSWPSDEDDDAPDLSNYVDQGTYDNIAAVPPPIGLGYYCTVTADQRVYVSALGETTGYLWYPAGYAPSDATVGDPDRAEDRTTEIRPARATVVSVQDQLFQVPLVPGRGSSKYYAEGASTSKPHIGLFHGMQPNQAGHTYPMASDLRYRMDGQAVGAVDLDWRTLVQLHHQGIAETWVGADPIEFDLQLTDLDQLSQLSASPTVLIHGQRCLLLSIPLKLDTQLGPLIARGVRAIKLLNP